MFSSEKRPWRRRLGGTLALPGLIAALAACGGSGPPAPSPAAGGAGTGRVSGSSSAPAQTGGARPQATTQTPVPAESNPPGDIPDTTVYITYRSTAGHLLLKVPEGWSRTSSPSSSTFTSNLNSITVTWRPAPAAPTVKAAKATTVPALRASTPAFRLQSVRAVPLAGGRAVEIIYQANSKPNAVTGRQYRLVIERFEFFHGGRAAVLSLSSAVGSDNVDPWRIVSESFRWM